MQKNNFNIHVEDFLFFRKSTDEIKVIIDEISKIISLININNFLDIGAGSGELTEAVVKKFKIKNTIGSFQLRSEPFLLSTKNLNREKANQTFSILSVVALQITKDGFPLKIWIF